MVASPNPGHHAQTSSLIQDLIFFAGENCFATIVNELSFEIVSNFEW